jgi:hypothetical protein
MQITRLLFTDLTAAGTGWNDNWNVKTTQNGETYPIVWAS